MIDIAKNTDSITIWIARYGESFKKKDIVNDVFNEDRDKEKHIQKNDKLYRRKLSRLLIRTALSKASKYKIPPENWIITKLPNGKPVAHCPSGKRIYFNLSHAENCVVVAVSSCNDVGIDVEPMAQDIHIEDIWAVLNDREICQLQSIPPEKRAKQIVRLWTLKEAYLKLLGTGLALDPASILVDISDKRVHLRDLSQKMSKEFKLFLKNWTVKINGKNFSLSLATWRQPRSLIEVSFLSFERFLANFNLEFLPVTNNY